MNPVRHKQNLSSADASTNRRCSPNIWADCPWLEMLQCPGVGVTFFDDFMYPPVLVTPTITTQANYGGGWKAFGSSGGTIISDGSRGGGLVLTESDDNEGFGLATIALPFKIIRGDGAFWFECRMKTNTITDTEHGFFVGLLDSATLSATVPIAAAGTLADENFVGFHRLEGDGDQLDTVYKADGVTQVSVQTDALAATPVSSALVADTYFKIGMKYDPVTFEFSWYYNNLKLSSTKTVPSAAGTDFPNDVNMGLVIAALCASNNDAIITVDWIRAAQRF